MAKAKQLPSGSWRVQVPTGEKVSTGKKSKDGKEIYRYAYESITMPTEKEANLAALEYELKHKEIAKNPANMTLSEAMKKYIDNKNNVLSPSTIRGYNGILKNNLKVLMPLKLIKLSSNIIQSAINDEARTCSPKTVKNIYGLLTAVLNLYYPDFRIKITLPQKERKEINILNIEQAKILFKAIENKDIEMPILLAAWCGLRESEITGLKWDCIDFENNIITIKRALVRGIDKYVLKSTKTFSSARKIKLPKFITNKLKNINKSGEFVINIKNNMIYKKFKRVLRENNLPDIRFHDLRHFNASVMLQLNIPDKYAMERGGWSTNNTMKNIYQHTFEKEREAVDALINNYFENLLKPT